AFVGGHPIAGGHRPGLAHARAELFDGAPYVLTGVEDGSDPRALDALEETLTRMGARVRVMSAEAHDRALAFVSHLPQLVSSAVAATVAEQANARELVGLSGAGYRDVTRLAASPWAVWRDILATNPAHVADALDRVLEKLSAVRAELRGVGEGAGALDATRALFDQTAPSETAAVSRPDAGLDQPREF
ncbi:MAG TPA: prephenate dehydrogenase/arogenate dehydrogenase family protein, partial [Pyrinomonadaceae bacterium]|nr:prephenate dehydrogenase/arogenate dehydrogenase family protein [Pyrinomonadaceae bacterium]